MITPLIKDEVLKYLCDDSMDFECLSFLNQELFLKTTKLDFDTLLAVLRQFKRLGFISELNARRHSLKLYLCVHLEALDFKNRGGFMAQEEYLKNNIEKLLLEIESLKPSMPSKVERLTTIAANITTALGLIFRY